VTTINIRRVVRAMFPTAVMQRLQHDSEGGRE
jgi:hypothetical protein